MLIWGWRSRLKTLSEGTFHCPKCGVDRQYKHREARRWFTLFFLPVIPLKVLGTFIECQTCKAGYDEKVLTLPTSAKLVDNLSVAMRGLVVGVMTADGAVDQAERELAVRIVSASVDHSYGLAELDADLVSFAGRGVEQFLGELAGTLNDHGKEKLVSACVELARADGNVDERELDVARSAGAALMMTPNHVRGIIADVLERTA